VVLSTSGFTFDFLDWKIRVSPFCVAQTLVCDYAQNSHRLKSLLLINSFRAAAAAD